MKKSILALALCLALSLSCPAALAEDAEDGEPVIRTSVSEAGALILNPYCLEVSVPGGGTTREQVVSGTTYISNESDVAVTVTARAAGSSSSGAVEYVQREPDPERKQLFLYMEFQPVAGGEEPQWSGAYTGADNQLVVGGSGARVAELPAGGESAAVCAFRLFGAASTSPADIWYEDVTIDVVFTFEAVSEASGAAEDEPAEDAPVEDESVEDEPAEDEPAEDEPVEDEPVEDTPVEDTPVEDTPVEDTPVEDTPAEDEPAEDEPTEDAPVEDLQDRESS